MACSPSPISSSFTFANPSSLPRPRNSVCCSLSPRAMAKELYFNHDGSATKKLLVRTNSFVLVIDKL